MTCLSRLLPAVLLSAVLLSPAAAAEIDFRPQLLPTRLDVGYAVRLIDMNQDEKLDICIVDSRRIIWLENPSWKEHTIIGPVTKKDNVCFAPYDIDGDGRLDFAVGADWTLNTKEGGTLQWIRRPEKPGDRWRLFAIGEEPTVHRIRFADLDGDKRKELIVAPLLGRGTTRPHFAERGVRLLSFKIPDDPAQDRWPMEVINDELHVVHNFWPTDLDRDGDTDLLVVSFEGVSLIERQKDGTWKRTLLGRGNQETSPRRGASEIKHGKFADGSDYLATIEPWHGTQVVVYTPKKGQPLGSPWQRTVIDDTLKWGHAVWCENLDDDRDQELIIGVRDTASADSQRGLRIYDRQEDGTWQRKKFDQGAVAIEDLAAGDLNGDGRVDIVAVGRQTHNVKIYWNATK